MDVGDDCFFFLHTECSKGAGCSFRHSDAAKHAEVCPKWQQGACHQAGCPLKHFQVKPKPAYTQHTATITSRVPCRWEQTPSGCTRPDCFFVHTRPRPLGEGSSGSADHLAGEDIHLSIYLYLYLYLSISLYISLSLSLIYTPNGPSR